MVPIRLRQVCKDSRRRTIFDSFRYAFRGIGFAIWTQRNMQIHMVVSLIVCVMGFFFKINKYEWISLVFVVFLVIIAETINTAIEVNVDLVTKKLRPRAMLAKDIAAGAVMLSAICAAIVGIIIFADKVYIF